MKTGIGCSVRPHVGELSRVEHCLTSWPVHDVAPSPLCRVHKVSTVVRATVKDLGIWASISVAVHMQHIWVFV